MSLQSPDSHSDTPDGLLHAAEPLLNLWVKLRAGEVHPDPMHLPDAVSRGIQYFVKAATKAGYSAEVVNSGAAVLRLLVADPMQPVDASPEASREVNGADPEFSLRQFLELLNGQLRLDHPAPALLGLLSAALSLGLEDRLLAAGYRAGEIKRLRGTLLHTVSMLEGGNGWRLSPHWQSDYRGRSPLAFRLPLWVAAALAGLVLLGAYQGFRVVAERSMAPIAVETEFLARPKTY